MSSKNRKKKSNANDDYQTPHPHAHQIARQLSREGWIRGTSPRLPGVKPHSVLEPSAGEGRLINWLGYFEHDLDVDAVEINPKYRRQLEATRSNVWISDFLKWQPPKGKKYDLIITNPPFSLTEEFIEKCLPLLKTTGHLVILQRLGLLGSQKRNERDDGKVSLWDKYTYMRMYLCTQRPSFEGGGNDSADYAWYMFEHPSKHLCGEGRKWRGGKLESYQNHAFERDRCVRIVHLPVPWKGAEDTEFESCRQQSRRGPPVRVPPRRAASTFSSTGSTGSSKRTGAYSEVQRLGTSRSRGGPPVRLVSTS